MSVPAGAIRVGIPVVKRVSKNPFARGIFVVWLLLFVLTTLTILGLFGSFQNRGQDEFGPSEIALSDIPGPMLELYQSAAKEFKIPWEILAAIGWIETDHGRNVAVSSAGALGPMQFMPATWRAYGDGGDVMNPADAVRGAARYLKASGMPAKGHPLPNVRRAIFSYNHANWYVDKVLERAVLYRGALQAAEADFTLLAGSANAKELLANKRVTIYPNGRFDLSSGAIDPRIIALIQGFAKEHTLTITSLKTGHSVFTAGGRVSAHSVGKAVDIAVVDGVNCTNTAQNAPCGKLAKAAVKVKGKLAPAQVIYLWNPGPPSGLALPDHNNHVHIGYR